MTHTIATLFALLVLLLGACADVASSARVRSSVAVELGAAGVSPTATAGASSTGGAAGAAGDSATAGSAGLPPTAIGGASSTAGAAGAAGSPTVDPCASPVLLPGAPLPAGAFRQVGREWRAHDNASGLAALPLPCAGSAIETDPVCRAWFPVLVEVCP